MEVKDSQEPTYQLNANQELFCNEYLKDRNQTQAYIRAGYSADGAKENASRLIANDNIRWRVNELLGEQISKIQLEVQYIIKGLLKATAVNIADAYESGTNALKNIHDMPEPLQRAILELTTEELFDGRGEDKKLIGYTKKIKLKDDLRAYEMLGRHLKMFVDVHEIPGLSNLAERMAAADKRAKEPPKPGEQI